MSLINDQCDYCGAHLDPMNSDAIARFARRRGDPFPQWHLWCDVECVQNWAKEDSERST